MWTIAEETPADSDSALTCCTATLACVRLDEQESTVSEVRVTDTGGLTIRIIFEITQFSGNRG